MSSRNKLVVPEAKQAVYDLKQEIAQDLGLQTYNGMSSAEFPALVNGLSVRQMVGMGENMLLNNKTNNNHDLH
jgi:hypothetical protein